MAEVIGISSGVVALAAFSFKSSIALRNAIDGFRNHPKRVRELIDETVALSGVLNWVTETADAATDIDLSVLEPTLEQCGLACNGFEKQLLECLSQSGETRATFKGWAKLQYMGDDVDSFRQKLATYKSTINIILTAAILRNSTITAEAIKSCEAKIKTTTDDLEERLETLDTKFEALLARSLKDSEPDSTALRGIEEERRSTRKGLQICAQLSEYLKNIQLGPAQRSRSSSRHMDPEPEPERIMKEGIQEFQESVRNTSARLNRHMQVLVEQLLAKSRTAATSQEDIAQLTNLQENFETNRQCLDLLFKAEKQLNFSKIDNYATGDDNIQLLVSTNGEVVHGKNKLLGSRTQQIGGHIDSASLQKVTQPNWRISSQIPGENLPPSQDDKPSVPADAAEDQSNPEFQDRYGPGFRLPSECAPVRPASGRQGESPASGVRKH